MSQTAFGVLIIASCNNNNVLPVMTLNLRLSCDTLRHYISCDDLPGK